MRTTRTTTPFDAMREMHRVLESLAARDNTGARTPSRAVPPINLWIEDGTIFLEAELPGTTPDEIEILADRDTLTLKAACTVQQPGEDTRVLRAERADRAFERTLTLPNPIDVDALSASLNNGVLRIALPPAGPTRPRKITINTDASDRN